MTTKVLRRLLPSRLAHTTYVPATHSFPMTAHIIKSKPFLHGRESFDHLPLLVKVILPAASTTATAKLPAVSTAAMATSFDHSQVTSSFDRSHNQATSSFDHNYSHQLRPQLQPQPPALTAAKLPKAPPTIKPSTSTAAIASSFNHSHSYSHSQKL
jgi:hypothetical protein